VAVEFIIDTSSSLPDIIFVECAVLVVPLVVENVDEEVSI
jgi:hypothetical protein